MVQVISRYLHTFLWNSNVDVVIISSQSLFGHLNNINSYDAYNMGFNFLNTNGNALQEGQNAYILSIIVYDIKLMILLYIFHKIMNNTFHIIFNLILVFHIFCNSIFHLKILLLYNQIFPLNFLFSLTLFFILIL